MDAWTPDETRAWAAVECDPASVQYASEDLKNDTGLAMKVVEKDPLALKWLGPDMKKDNDVVERAFVQDFAAYQYAIHDTWDQHHRWITRINTTYAEPIGSVLTPLSAPEQPGD